MNLAHIDLISVFVIALSAAFSHCLGMCGGIVLVYSQLNATDSFMRRFVTHLIYGFGRITTYMIIGGIVAYIGSNISINNSTKGGIFIIVGLLIVLFGILMLFAPKILRFIEPNIANIGIFRRFFMALLGKKTLYSFYILGILNGALPCGVVYFFALSASVAGGVLQGVLVMLVFGVATMISLTLLGVFSTILSFTKYRNIIATFTSILIILFGIWTFFKGFRILFS